MSNEFLERCQSPGIEDERRDPNLFLFGAKYQVLV